MSKKTVEEVLGVRNAKELWTVAYRPVLPVSPADFTLGGVLPTVLYMMRWGCRRGKGHFFDVYTSDPTITRVASHLSSFDQWFQGFEGEVQQAVLGDLFLAFCLENRNHKPGREERVQRAFPAHYFSSWVDLPRTSIDLRWVPEMVVTILARQPAGATIRRNNDGHYAIGAGFERNLLLKLFGPGAYVDGVDGQADNLSSDRLDENTGLGIDQLLTIRLAQSLKEAPVKLRGDTSDIPNQLPVAQRSTEFLHEDLNVFLRAYAERVPRQSLLPMLESCLSVGLTSIYLSTLPLMLIWAETGRVPTKGEQPPWPLFADCSVSADVALRRVSEECMDDLIQRLNRLPIILMCLRILDQQAREEGLDLPVSEPNATARINMLGDILHGRVEESRDIMRDIRKTCIKLGDALGEGNDVQARQILLAEDQAISPCWRLAEALVTLMGDPIQVKLHRAFLDSILLVNQPNGLGRKRRSPIKGKVTERRSLVLTNTVLDFLVHRHLRKACKDTRPISLSLARFTEILKDRYGFYIAEAPPGMTIPSDMLQRNRAFLERRLRDLGLLRGANDAEAMKRLCPRYAPDGDNDD